MCYGTLDKSLNILLHNYKVSLIKEGFHEMHPEGWEITSRVNTQYISPAFNYKARLHLRGIAQEDEFWTNMIVQILHLT